MKKTPLVSLLIISYKHKQFIRDCFQSILAQTYNAMEILYLDDASEDGTFEKACEYEERLKEKFQKVIFIKNVNNLGVVKNLNRLIEVCQGEYVKFLAADDFLFSDGIEKLINFMYENPQYDMVYSNGVSGNENTHFPISNINDSEYLYLGNQPAGTSLFESLYAGDFILAPGVMVRKTVYEKVGLYDESLGTEDWDFFLRVSKEGSIGYFDGTTVMYRRLTNSLSHSSSPERRINMKKSELMILEKYRGMSEHGQERMKYSLNEALSDSFHIGNNEYIAYLCLYARKNGLRVTMKNRLKYVLYMFRVIKIFDFFSHDAQG